MARHTLVHPIGRAALVLCLLAYATVECTTVSQTPQTSESKVTASQVTAPVPKVSKDPEAQNLVKEIKKAATPRSSKVDPLLDPDLRRIPKRTGPARGNWERDRPSYGAPVFGDSENSESDPNSRMVEQFDPAEYDPLGPPFFTQNTAPVVPATPAAPAAPVVPEASAVPQVPPLTDDTLWHQHMRSIIGDDLWRHHMTKAYAMKQAAEQQRARVSQWATEKKTHLQQEESAQQRRWSQLQHASRTMNARQKMLMSEEEKENAEQERLQSEKLQVQRTATQESDEQVQLKKGQQAAAQQRQLEQQEQATLHNKSLHLAEEASAMQQHTQEEEQRLKLKRQHELVMQANLQRKAQQQLQAEQLEAAEQKQLEAVKAKQQNTRQQERRTEEEQQVEAKQERQVGTEQQAQWAQLKAEKGHLQAESQEEMERVNTLQKQERHFGATVQSEEEQIAEEKQRLQLERTKQAQHAAQLQRQEEQDIAREHQLSLERKAVAQSEGRLAASTSSASILSRDAFVPNGIVPPYPYAAHAATEEPNTFSRAYQHTWQQQQAEITKIAQEARAEHQHIEPRFRYLAEQKSKHDLATAQAEKGVLDPALVPPAPQVTDETGTNEPAPPAPAASVVKPAKPAAPAPATAKAKTSASTAQTAAAAAKTAETTAPDKDYLLVDALVDEAPKL
jgi:hypothetical protein